MIILFVFGLLHFNYLIHFLIVNCVSKLIQNDDASSSFYFYLQILFQIAKLLNFLIVSKMFEQCIYTSLIIK